MFPGIRPPLNVELPARVSVPSSDFVKLLAPPDSEIPPLMVSVLPESTPISTFAVVTNRTEPP